MSHVVNYSFYVDIHSVTHRRNKFVSIRIISSLSQNHFQAFTQAAETKLINLPSALKMPLIITNASTKSFNYLSLAKGGKSLSKSVKWIKVFTTRKSSLRDAKEEA